jgi:ERCC4-related helicase
LPLTPYVAQVERRFDRLWQGKEESWLALEIPEAARRKLLSFCPPVAPTVDPLEDLSEVKPPEAMQAQVSILRKAQREESMLFQFLREVPFFPNAQQLGTETSTVSPWPHQVRIVQEAVKRFPERFLFCDEVGLGKTIEAGLVLRQLIISGLVKRALLLVPKSVLRQWQEELYEKFVLNLPRCDGGEVMDVFDRNLPWSGDSVWNAYPLLLASSQLVKRRDRQAELLVARPWDLIIVDEAHHARRKDFLSDRYRPNRLLELLAGTRERPGLKEKTRSLYLLTATPMQVHPVEVWDLLKVLGVGGRWGASQDNFLNFFKELRLSVKERNWDFLLTMVRDYLEAGGTIDPAFCETAERELGFIESDIVKGLPFSNKRQNALSQLSQSGLAFLHEMVRYHTPIRSFVWRNTRNLLRKYREKGLLKADISRREPRNQWVELKEGPGNERELYDRIEEYISDFYHRYEAERKGLGFVMTVYRRRLTSSFYALMKSLERRHAFLKGQVMPLGGLTDDDIEQEDLDRDVSEELSNEDRSRFKGELEYIEHFLYDLKTLSIDSKLERLFEDVGNFFKQRDTIILFTQYTDTMDYLRDQLREVYGSQVACYSGRGGERWDGVAWVLRSKEEIKTAFRQGDEIKILLCTEAASEGLNLQTCGVIINYDMPWNPMRVEQRIGRIDRIGQRFETVWVSNYFYQDTVEAIVYQRLGDRISWFEDVVGSLQPILHQVGRTIERAAMLKGKERKKRLQEEIAEIRREIELKSAEGLNLEEFITEEFDTVQTPSPVTLHEIEKVLVSSEALGKCFRAHPEWPGVYLLTWAGEEIAVTFSPEIFDLYPNTVQLLSYGNPLFDSLIKSVEQMACLKDPAGVGLYKAAGPAPLSTFFENTHAGVQPVHALTGFRAVLSEGAAPWSVTDVETADSTFQEALNACYDAQRRAEDNRKQSELLALKEEARQVLIRAAFVELAIAQEPNLFSEPFAYVFGQEAVLALKRYGAPYKGLFQIADSDGLTATPTDPFFATVQGQPIHFLHRKRDSLKQQGLEILHKVAAMRSGSQTESMTDTVVPEKHLHRSWYAIDLNTPSSTTSD